MKDKIILVFSDLEGTIIGESNGVYDEERMKLFLEELVNLQVVTGAEVKLHLVSPVYRRDMERILKQLDRSILRFNAKQHSKSKTDTNLLLSTVQGAAAYPEETVNDFFVSAFERHSSDHRIADLKMPIGKRDLALGASGKEDYVRDWCESARRRGNLLFSIYMGNGNNDLAAIRYLRSKPDTLVISPANSILEVKNNSYFSSDKEELEGITEGIVAIREEIEKRIASKKQEKMASLPKSFADDDGDEPR